MRFLLVNKSYQNSTSAVQLNKKMRVTIELKSGEKRLHQPREAKGRRAAQSSGQEEIAGG